MGAEHPAGLSQKQTMGLFVERGNGELARKTNVSFSRALINMIETNTCKCGAASEV